MTADAGATETTRRGNATAIVLAMTSVAVAIAICSAFLVIGARDGFWRSLLLLWLVAIGGALLVFRTASCTGDDRVLNLVHVHALKLVLGFAVLHFGWIPSLDQTSPMYGYDPQRYYFESEELRASGFNTAALPSLKYTAVLYFYGGLYGIFGFNPYAPALFNSLVALWGMLAVLRAAYAVKTKRSPGDWMLGLTLLIPEIIWFDQLVSRETLNTALMSVGVLGSTSYLLPKDVVKRLKIVGFASAIPSLLFLGILRTSALAASMAAIGAIYFLHRMTMRQRLLAVAVLVIAGAALAAAPSIVLRLGGYELTYLEELNPSYRAQTALNDPQYIWGENSVGRRLVGDTPAKLVFFAPIRMLSYIILPLPIARPTLEGLRAGSWWDWQGVLMDASSIIYIFIVPWVLALAIEVVRKRSIENATMFLVAFGVIYSGIVIGNQILHERYRVMSVPLLAACAWLGRDASRSSRRRALALWIFILAGAVAGYAAMKVMA
ncbi:MAG TPA: hypothetical protein VMU84_16100 [Thermoanaerobaculia bacterium]|nr:hypothetical protein [Thermoanaerobaculia bacterium]